MTGEQRDREKKLKRPTSSVL